MWGSLIRFLELRPTSRSFERQTSGTAFGGESGPPRLFKIIVIVPSRPFKRMYIAGTGGEAVAEMAFPMRGKLFDMRPHSDRHSSCLRVSGVPSTFPSLPVGIGQW
jgi:hypothetical protein